MLWYHYLSLVALITCLVTLGYHLTRVIRAGKPQDWSQRVGNLQASVVYSFTGAMSPAKKESAYLHLPTYTAGMIFHLGTFLAIALFFIFILKFAKINIVYIILASVLAISTLCGVAILIKRMVKPSLRSLSSPDDYISNALVTLFQASTVMMLLIPETETVYFVITALLLFYIPVGKLRHAIYFFAARYHLGVFFGHRNVWPPKPL